MKTGGGRANLVFGGGATTAIDTAPCLSSHGGRFDFDTEALAVDTHNGLVSSETTGTLLSAQDRGNRGHAILEAAPVLEINGRRGKGYSKRDRTGIGKFGDPAFTLKADKQNGVIAFDLAQVTSKENRSNPKPGGPAPSLAETSRPALAFHMQQTPIHDDVSLPLEAGMHGMGALTPRGQVRRLTPRECERLQGFDDDYTAIDGAADGPRYRALGNSMAVPCMSWLAKRIELVEAALRRAS